MTFFSTSQNIASNANSDSRPAEQEPEPSAFSFDFNYSRDSSDSDIIESDSDTNDDHDDVSYSQPLPAFSAIPNNMPAIPVTSSTSSFSSSLGSFDNPSDSTNIDTDTDSDLNDSMHIISDNESDLDLNSSSSNISSIDDNLQDYTNDDDALVPRMTTSNLTYHTSLSSLPSLHNNNNSSSSLSSLNSNTLNGTATLFAAAAAAGHTSSDSPTISSSATFTQSLQARLDSDIEDDSFFSFHNSSTTNRLAHFEEGDQIDQITHAVPPVSPSLAVTQRIGTPLPDNNHHNLVSSSSQNPPLPESNLPSNAANASKNYSGGSGVIGLNRMSGSFSTNLHRPTASSLLVHAPSTMRPVPPNSDHDSNFQTQHSQNLSSLSSSPSHSSLILESPAFVNHDKYKMADSDQLTALPPQRKKSGVLSLAAKFEQQDSPPPAPLTSYRGRPRRPSISTSFGSLTSQNSARTSPVLNRTPLTDQFSVSPSPVTPNSANSSSPVFSKRIVIPKTFASATSSSSSAPLNPPKNTAPRKFQRPDNAVPWVKRPVAKSPDQSSSSPIESRLVAELKSVNSIRENVSKSDPQLPELDKEEIASMPLNAIESSTYPDDSSSSMAPSVDKKPIEIISSENLVSTVPLPSPSKGDAILDSTIVTSLSDSSALNEIPSEDFTLTPSRNSPKPSIDSEVSSEVTTNGKYSLSPFHVTSKLTFTPFQTLSMKAI